MIDSGIQLFLDGELYYRQLGELTLNLCVARTITDVGWRGYLDSTLAMSRKLGRPPKVSLTALLYTHPNAMQRRMTTEFMEHESVPPIVRIALLTDNQLLRGAMTAFNWALPKSRFRAFKGNDHTKGLAWLCEVAEFDKPVAEAAWVEARTKLKVAGSRVFL